MTLIEMAMAAGIGAILLAVIASTMWGIAKSQRRSQLDATLASVGQRIRSAVEAKNDDLIALNNSWINTVNDASNVEMTCIRNMTQCPNAAPGVLYPLALHESDNTVIADGHSATAGFDLKGQPCNTFSAADTSCILSYNMGWRPMCPAVGSCINPTIQVVGTLNLSSGTGLESGINFNNYRINLVRAIQDLYQPIIIQWTPAVGTNGGTCTPGVWVTRQIADNGSPQSSILQDPGSNVLNITATQVILRPGNYHCKIFGTVNQVGGTKMRIFETSPTATTLMVGPGMISAPGYNVQLTTHVQGVFTFLQNTTLEIDQACAQSTGATDLGVSSGVGPTTYSSIECEKVGTI